MSVAKRLGGAALVYGLGGVAARMVSILLLPFLTRFLTPTDYGVVAMLGLLTSFLVGVVQLGTGNSMGVCFHEADETREQNAVVWSTFLVISANATLWFLAGVLSSEWISNRFFGSGEHALLVSIAFGQLALISIVQPFLSQWRMQEKSRVFVAAALFLSVMTAAFSLVAVVWLRLGLVGMFLGAGLAQIIHCCVVVAVNVRNVPFVFSAHWAKRVVRLGWPSIFGIGAFFLIDFSGRALLEYFHGLGELGVFSLGVSFGLAMTILADGAFGAAWPGFFMAYLNRREDAQRDFPHVLYAYLALYCALCLGFFLFAEPVVRILTTEAFYPAAKVVGVIALASVLKGVYLIFLPGLYFERKLHLQTMMEWAAAITSVVMCLLLIPLLGMVGAALAPIVGYVVLALLSYRVSQRFLPLKLDSGKLLVLIVVFLVVAVAGSFQWLESMVLDAVCRTVVFFALAFFYWRFSMREALLNLDIKFR